ncbi:MAG: hypothetical protein KAK04_16695 [Cyclobacteriaceae bacterium]|nr:hypothetical protein [Cyclobacteriaceae bacterium]
MKIESKKIEGDFVIQENLQFSGMITGNAIVTDGVLLDLHGTVGKDLVVKEGGKAVVKGTVEGDVINQGGAVDIYGNVAGNVNGQANIYANAIVKGVIVR